jgi:hypothetical protein
MAIFKFCILCLMLMLAGCGKTPEQTATEKKIEDSAGVDTKVDLQKNEMTITGETKGGRTQFLRVKARRYRKISQPTCLSIALPGLSMSWICPKVAHLA